MLAHESMQRRLLRVVRRGVLSSRGRCGARRHAAPASKRRCGLSGPELREKRASAGEVAAPWRRCPPGRGESRGADAAVKRRKARGRRGIESAHIEGLAEPFTSQTRSESEGGGESGGGSGRRRRKAEAEGAAPADPRRARADQRDCAGRQQDLRHDTSNTQPFEVLAATRTRFAMSRSAPIDEHAVGGRLERECVRSRPILLEVACATRHDLGSSAAPLAEAPGCQCLRRDLTRRHASALGRPPTAVTAAGDLRVPGSGQE